MFVGLMQVPNIGNAQVTPAVGAQNAWNWVTNCDAGNSVFRSKLADAQTYNDNQTEYYLGLPQQSGTQLEDNALSGYGGWLGACGSYYWRPDCSGKIVPIGAHASCNGGSFSWQVVSPANYPSWSTNSVPCTKMINYIYGVNGVRNAKPPTNVCSG